MKIASVAVTGDETGQVVTIGLRFAALKDISVLVGQAYLALARGQEIGNFTATDQIAPAGGPPVVPASPPGAEHPPASRRRRGNPLEAAPAAQAPLAPSPETAAPSIRRRRAPGAETPSAGQSAVTAPTAAPQSPSDARPTSRRRAPSTGASAPQTQPAAASELSDADLSKAASEAARVLTPKVVMGILADFKVKGTQDLKGADRRKFVEGLKSRMATDNDTARAA